VEYSDGLFDNPFLGREAWTQSGPARIAYDDGGSGLPSRRFS
jgi:hypothetical protein